MNRESPLAQAYLYHRQQRPSLMSRRAIELARQDGMAGKRRYAHGAGYKPGGNWQSDESRKQNGTIALRWNRAYFCDDWPEWRLTGRADEVSRANESRAIDHSGWYTDDDCGDTGTIAGYVLQLPARDGVPQYVPGTRHSEWDGVTLYPLDRYAEPLDCARAADRYAERDAETERDYQRAWQAGNRSRELTEESVTARREILQICRDLRVMQHAIDIGEEIESAKRLCSLARDKVSDLLDSIREARSERDKLVSDYGNEAGFSDV